MTNGAGLVQPLLVDPEVVREPVQHGDGPVRSEQAPTTARNGEIDEAAIYNRGLTADEAHDLFKRGGNH